MLSYPIGLPQVIGYRSHLHQRCLLGVEAAITYEAAAGAFGNELAPVLLWPACLRASCAGKDLCIFKVLACRLVMPDVWQCLLMGSLLLSL